MKETKTICFFAGDITRSGGTERIGTQIMNALCEDYRTFAVSLTESNNRPFYTIHPSVKRTALFDRRPNGKWEYPAIVSRLRRFLRRYQIDLLIDMDTVLDAFSVPAIFGTDVKLIAWEHFHFDADMGTVFRVPFRKLFTRRADLIVTLTQEDRDRYQRAFRGGTRVEQIYNPMIPPETEPVYDTASHTIISVGRLARQKGFDYLIQIADIVRKRHPHWQWLILGEGEEREKLEAMLAERCLSQVRLVGKVDHVGDYLSHAAMFVLTSRFEGFSLALAEAKAHRLPVVSFRCPSGPSELVIDGVNGYLVECFDIEQMAESICKLIENDERRKAFSSRSLMDCEKLDFAGVTAKWKQIINDLLA